MRKIFLISLIVIFSGQIMAQYENADAVYKKLVKEYTLNPDGTWNYHEEKELELLTHFSFHRLYGETFIVYNPEYQDLDIDYTYTIMRDGKRVEAPDNAFNKVLPRGAANAPAYSHLREMVVTHTGLEVGAVIHLGYTINNSENYFPVFMGREVIGENSPVEEMELRVIVPGTKELTHKTFNIRTAPEVTREKGKTVYTWEFKNLEASAHEAYQSVVFQPLVLFSTGKDLHRTYDKIVNQEAFKMQAGSQSMEKVKELTADAGELQAMINIQEFVVDRIAEYHVDLQEAAYKVATPDQVWNSNGGTKLEKSILMAAMLRQANINANVVAVIPDKYFDREMGNLLVFEDFLVQVNPKEYGQYYLSATGHKMENLKYTLAGKQLLIMNAAIESLRTFSEAPYDNNIAFECEMTMLEDSSLSGQLESQMQYHFSHYLKFIDDSAHVKKLVSGINMKDYEIKKATEGKLQFQAAFEMKKAFEGKSGYLFFQLPEPAGELPERYLSKLPSERKTNLVLPFPAEYSYEYKLQAAEGYQGIIDKKEISIENEAGSLLIQIRQKGKDVIVKRELHIPERIIEVKNYGAFRELMMNWFDEKYKKIVLEKSTL